MPRVLWATGSLFKGSSLLGAGNFLGFIGAPGAWGVLGARVFHLPMQVGWREGKKSEAEVLERRKVDFGK